ncbi:MAG: FAD-dependent oxidoreductase [Alphaproteobacteria bacterium]|nr:FAD-dependent oxidoreductase [Alphaproteobacteria bacterium]
MTRPAAMREEAIDLAVLGAGPAGMGAAIAAGGLGLSVRVFDEAERPGGQVYRALPPAFRVTDRASLGPDFAAGEALRGRFAASGAVLMAGHRVWNVATGFVVDTAAGGSLFRWRARGVIAATGAMERILPFAGWTTPGVIGLAAATILLKAQQMLPGRRTVVAGVGPLLYAVAASILKGGGQVAAVVDAASLGEWLSALPAMASRTDLLRRGAAWQLKIRRAGVPMLYRHAVRSVAGEGSVSAVTAGPVDAEGHPVAGAERRFEADSLAVGHGLIPGTEVTRLLRARHDYISDRGGWVAAHDADGRTSVARLYVAGDGAGIAGAAAAEHSGTLAGLAAAHDLGALDGAAHAAASSHARAAWRKADRFGAAMAHMMRARPGLLDAATPGTVICRCEDVTRAQVDEMIAKGAATLNQLKSWTRCGMGPCQGRICADAAATLIAARTGDREAVGQHTARLPLRPLPIAPLVEGFDYEAEVAPPLLVPV